MEENPTFNEAYLMRLLNLKTLAELSQFLREPDCLEGLRTMEPPYDFYEEIAKAAKLEELIEDLERLYALPSAPLNRQL